MRRAPGRLKPWVSVSDRSSSQPRRRARHPPPRQRLDPLDEVTERGLKTSFVQGGEAFAELGFWLLQVRGNFFFVPKARS
jgi:hypothetical protein